MSILALASNTLVGTAASGQIEYDGQFFGTDSNSSRAQLQRIVQGTVNAGGTNPFPASSGPTAVDYTNIPTWVKKITVMFSGVSTSGTSNYLVQIGAGSVAISGYVAGSMSGATYVSSTAGFILVNNITAADLFSGIVVLTNITSNTWVSSSNINRGGSAVLPAAGNIALGGTLDRVRITTVLGTDLFDAGSINILYEG